MNRKDELYQLISDASKDAQGFRHRFDYTTWTVEQLEAEAARWCARAEQAVIEQREEEQKAAAAFEKTVSIVIDAGAGDRETAIRWLTDEEGLGYTEYRWGLPYGYLANASQEVRA